MLKQLFSSKNQITLKNNIHDFINLYAKTDNWHHLDSETGNLGFGWLHYAFIRELRPERVLVIGSQYGFIPAICALACRDNHKGIVDFVDAGYDLNDASDPNRMKSGGVGFWHKINTRHHFQKFGLEKYIQTHVITSAQFFQKNCKLSWQYIYIDGDHSYSGVKFDFETFWPKLSTNGLMVFHDIYQKGYTIKPGLKLSFGVWRFWQEVERSKKYRIITFPAPFGLGILQK